MQNTLHYLCYNSTGYLHKMPRVHKWTCLRGSEWTPFVDVFFMQQRADTRQLNSKWTEFYYNSVLIVMLCIWQSESLVINIIVCPARDACWRDNHCSTTMKRFYCSTTHKCISHDINNSRPIYTIYKVAKIFLNNLPYLIEKKIKDLNHCRHAPLSVKDYEKWNLKL